jgi:16S rRNA (guanine527-N7)-methyltransferase
VSHPLAGALSEGLNQLGLALSPAQQQQLLDYLDLLGKWNKVYNLTAVRDPAQMLTQHLLDCLAVVQPLKARLPALQTLLDVGGGRRPASRGLGRGLPAVAGECGGHRGQKSRLYTDRGAQLGPAQFARHPCPGGGFDREL